MLLFSYTFNSWLSQSELKNSTLLPLNYLKRSEVYSKEKNMLNRKPCVLPFRFISYHGPFGAQWSHIYTTSDEVASLGGGSWVVDRGLFFSLNSLILIWYIFHINGFAYYDDEELSWCFYWSIVLGGKGVVKKKSV